MNLTVKKSNLEAAVKSLCRVISPKVVLPVLSNILCEVKEKHMTLTASDTEIWLSYQIDLEKVDLGKQKLASFCVGARLLSDALANLKEQPLEISFEGGEASMIRIDHETGFTCLPTDHSGDEYPQFPQDLEDVDPIWKLSGDFISRALKRSMFATAHNELRPVLGGIFFNMHEGNSSSVLDVTATDGSKLILTEKEITELLDAKGTPINGDGSFLMPKKVANVICATIGPDCEIRFNDSYASCKYGNATLQFRQLEGKYPNYRSVIPECDHSFNAFRLELLSALKNVASFTNSSSRMVTLTLASDKDRLVINGNDYDLSIASEDSIEIECNEKIDMTIGAKVDSLIESLQKISTPDTEICFVDPSRPFLIHPSDPADTTENVTILIMPMLVNA